jgi:hypothetical protein
MKKYIFILIVVAISSCKNSKKEEVESVKVLERELRPFFDSDKVDHYYLNFSEDDFMNHMQIEKPNDDEKEFSGLFTGHFPESIPKENFEKILLRHKYKKSDLSIKQEKKIENIFSEKDSLKNEACACIAEYKDIFIFKKKTKTVGIAKICFKNARFQIIGSKIDTKGFGLIDELDKLKKIVRPQSYSILVTD